MSTETALSSDSEAVAPEFDPGWLLRRTLHVTPGKSGASPEEAIVAWLVRLPDDIEPAEAAGDVMRAYATPPGTDPVGTRLFELLDEIQRFPQERLTRMSRAPGRRGRARRSRQTGTQRLL